MRNHMRVAIRLVAFWSFMPLAVMFGQMRNHGSSRIQAGEQHSQSASAPSDGADGRETTKEIAGFARHRTFPDFTACDQTTPEPNTAWKDVILHGGPARGFSEIMPSFADALTSEQIDDVIAFLRGLCRNPRWARGELNLPRALVTEKAYPEDEVVVSTAVNARGTPGVMNHIIYQKHITINYQLKPQEPITFQDENHVWYGGVGDTTLALKRVMFSSLRTGSIMSLQGGVLLPTGNKARGFGTGTTTFQGFSSFNQLFPTNTFVQMQFGGDLARHTDIFPQSIYFQSAVA